MQYITANSFFDHFYGNVTTNPWSIWSSSSLKSLLSLSTLDMKMTNTNELSVQCDDLVISIKLSTTSWLGHHIKQLVTRPLDERHVNNMILNNINNNYFVTALSASLKQGVQKTLMWFVRFISESTPIFLGQGNRLGIPELYHVWKSLAELQTGIYKKMLIYTCNKQ